MGFEYNEWLDEILARAGEGITSSDLRRLVNAWFLEFRPRWLRPQVDPATGIHTVMIWSRLDDGRAVAVHGRVSEFEEWESRR
ncbi:hypothetical protein [Nocardia heshunensis]